MEPPLDVARQWMGKVIAALADVQTPEALEAVLTKMNGNRDAMRVKRPELSDEVEAAIEAAAERLRPMPMPDTVAQDGMDDSEVPF